ncbi:alpha/beta hydrolase [Tepiditoga spiralis]|uniref:Alpha/beta hydrolase n=1 Tax=Tepiditoga spiralis TaxID=2108365 RepID=A0A7G1G7D0_9BACT|nr:alpha/beta hydrolase [Tepiditoga spiralis]BBE30783.1 alpha/beta hydrolase [Tepiditoga spiralis]
MKIDFNYEKQKIKYISGYIFKGRHYRCDYIRFPTLYRNPAIGTETVEIYNYKPKEKSSASVLILHGLGSANIKFLLWMGSHLASVDINATILILPGNYTRVDNKSVSGRNYLWPQMNVMKQFWENSVVDVMSTIDFLEQENLWKKDNNCVLGYCLGGMVSTITSAFDKRIKDLILMTVGGHLPSIMYDSPATKFIRRLIKKGFKSDYNLSEPEKMFDIYEKQFQIVKYMTANEIITSNEIHPLFKIDPLSYAHLLDANRVTFIEAIFDRTLSRKSRKKLLKEFKKSNHYLIPIGHVSWLPFQYMLAQYIMNKLNIKDLKLKARLLEKQKIDEEF